LRGVSIYFWTAAGAALLLNRCIDRKASPAQLTTSARAAPLARPSANPEASTGPGPAPRPWGSDRLRFATSNPECAALAADTTRRLAQVK